MRIIYLAFCLMIAVCLFSAEALAQGETTSAIVGQVSDATNAAVAGASVTVTSRETGAMRNAQGEDR